MTPHRWAAVVMMDMPDDDAARLHASADADGPTRLTLALVGEMRDVVGPFCADCRVSYADVHHDEDKPWPCPGPRPAALGGTLDDHGRQVAPAPSRQARRQARREAMRPVSITHEQAMTRLAGRRAAETARFTKSTSEQEV